MGATLEIQRSQQMEAIEQHMQRQQVKKGTLEAKAQTEKSQEKEDESVRV